MVHTRSIGALATGLVLVIVWTAVTWAGDGASEAWEIEPCERPSVTCGRPDRPSRDRPCLERREERVESPPGPPKLLTGMAVDLPTACVLPPGGMEVDSRVSGRWIGKEVFSNLEGATCATLDIRLRAGVSPCVEAYGGVSVAADGARLLIVSGETAWNLVPAVSAGVKVRLPDPVLGHFFVLGGGTSLIARDDKRWLTPDEYNRLTPFYMVASRSWTAAFRTHVGFRRGRVLATDLGGGTNLTSFCSAVEYVPAGPTRYAAELILEKISNRVVGDLGTTLAFDSPSLNLGVTHAFGDGTGLQVYGRRLNRSDYFELGLVWARRL